MGQGHGKRFLWTGKLEHRLGPSDRTQGRKTIDKFYSGSKGTASLGENCRRQSWVSPWLMGTAGLKRAATTGTVPERATHECPPVASWPVQEQL